jgi:hypothetical protein
MQIFLRRRFLALAGSLLLGSLFFSCAGAPKAAPDSQDDRGIPADTPGQSALPETPGEDNAAAEAIPPEKLPPPEEPPVEKESFPEEPAPEGIPLMGEGVAGQTDLSTFLLNNNPDTDPLFAEELAVLYLEESAVEGINHDIAFAQMCLETGFLRYGGLVKPEMNNFCGLGALNADHPGESFPSPRIGVRAHIQHLKAYASDEGLNQELVDPRYRWVRYGSSPTVEKLTGTWAADREYGTKLRSILERLRSFTGVE